LTAASVKAAYEAGRAGKQAYALGPPPPAETLDVLPDTNAPAPPTWVRWDFDGAAQRSNTCRGEITLHGWWRWQVCEDRTTPPDPGKWLYRKVPSGDGRGERFYAFDAARAPRKDLKPDKGLSWYEREFRLPADWAGRRIELEIDAISGRSAVYINRRQVARLPAANAGATIDITPYVRQGVTNGITVRTKGLVGNLSLRSLPKGARLGRHHIVTSVRQRRVNVDGRVLTDQPAGLRVTAEISADAGGKQSLLRFPTADIVDGSAALMAPLPEEAKLWSLEHPNLYWYRLTLADGAGKQIDQTLPRRFGFREFWIEKDRFILNGTPVQLYGHSHPHFITTAETGVPGFANYMIQRWKDAGLNATYNWNYGRSLQAVFDAADEIGFLFVPKMLPSPASGSGQTDEYLAGYRKLLHRSIDKYRDHPSIVAWMVNPGGSHVWDFCPAKMDDSFRPEDLGFTKSLVERLRQSREEVRRVDPDRLGFHHSSGNEGPVHSSMAYMTFDVDLRERANWPKAWSRTRHKPVLVCEWGLPMGSAWYARTAAARRRYPHHNAIPLYTQYAAMYFGSDAYSWEDDGVLDRLSKPGAWGAFHTCSSVLRLKERFATENIRAWRTYGISFFFHAEVPTFFTGETPKLDLGIDPRIRGAVPDYIPAHISAVWQSAEGFSTLGRTVQALLAPVLAYIGGPGGEFTNTDHSFFPGETVRKALIVINDTPRQVAITGEWTAQDAGAVLARGTLRGSVAAGARAIEAFPIEFLLPAGAKARREVVIRATWRADSGGAQTTQFAVEILPRKQPVPKKGRDVVLFDPHASAAAMLKQASVAYRDADDNLLDDGETLLVIGRRALAAKTDVAKLAAARLDQAVRRGMNVLVFEQAPAEWEGTVMGLRLRETSTRIAFSRAAGHPALVGIHDADLHHWRGDSDLVEAYPEPP
ncbi:MAG: hypothetical protein HN904_26460, partial [Victivallales bacterium]|nr:hypothetical protein [Victivallales bacterium]